MQKKKSIELETSNSLTLSFHSARYMPKFYDSSGRATDCPLCSRFGDEKQSQISFLRSSLWRLDQHISSTICLGGNLLMPFGWVACWIRAPSVWSPDDHINIWETFFFKNQIQDRIPLFIFLLCGKIKCPSPWCDNVLSSVVDFCSLAHRSTRVQVAK